MHAPVSSQDIINLAALAWPQDSAASTIRMRLPHQLLSMMELPPVEFHPSSTLGTPGSRSPAADYSAPLKGDPSMDYYISRIQLFLQQIDYRYITLHPSLTTFVNAHHDWIHNTLGPMTSWSTNKLNQLDVSSLTSLRGVTHLLTPR